MLLMPGHNGLAGMFELAPGFFISLNPGSGRGDLDDGEPVFVAPPVTMTAGAYRRVATEVPCVAQRIPISPGRQLRKELEADFPAGCECHDCIRGRVQLQLI